MEQPVIAVGTEHRPTGILPLRAGSVTSAPSKSSCSAPGTPAGRRWRRRFSARRLDEAGVKAVGVVGRDAVRREAGHRPRPGGDGRPGARHVGAPLPQARAEMVAGADIVIGMARSTSGRRWRSAPDDLAAGVHAQGDRPAGRGAGRAGAGRVARGLAGPAGDAAGDAAATGPRSARRHAADDVADPDRRAPPQLRAHGRGARRPHLPPGPACWVQG